MMTLTRGSRISIAIIFAVVAGLTVFVWGNQRQAHAQVVPPNLALQNICYVDWLLHQTDPGIPFDPQIDYCGQITPPATMQCADGIDNDGDGLIDLNDPGCSNASDNDEGNVIPPFNPQCFDGIDNDGDGKIDWGIPGDPNRDPGCDTPTDNNEADNGGGGTPAQCADGIDNDNDGFIDLTDPGCANAADNDESNGGGGGSPQCSDALDNDLDGKIDFPADPDCVDAQDNDEATSTATTTDTGGGASTGGSGGGGSSHHRSGGSGSSSGGGEVLGAETECTEYLTSYIRWGGNNDAEQVARLQWVLKQFEDANIDISGVYDAATLRAVNAFQSKYAGDVLAPWSLKAPTGYVYYTTRKKVNEVFCQGTKEFPLTAGQLQEITQVKMLNQTGAYSGSSGTGSRSTAPGTLYSGTSIDQNAVPATASKAAKTATKTASSTTSAAGSWWDRFWAWLFGR